MIYQCSAHLITITLVSAALFNYCRDRRIVRFYVFVLLLADVPHWLSILAAMGSASTATYSSATEDVGLLSWTAVSAGWQRCMRDGNWTSGMKGMFGAPFVTTAVKIAYLVGVFGKDRV